MDDCSKVVDFYKERKRMCTFNSDDCSECPLSIQNNGTNLPCDEFVARNIDKAVSAVQALSDDHPKEEE